MICTEPVLQRNCNSSQQMTQLDNNSAFTPYSAWRRIVARIDQPLVFSIEDSLYKSIRVDGKSYDVVTPYRYYIYIMVICDLNLVIRNFDKYTHIHLPRKKIGCVGANLSCCNKQVCLNLGIPASHVHNSKNH